MGGRGAGEWPQRDAKGVSQQFWNFKTYKSWKSLDSVMTFCCGYVTWQDGSENFAKCLPCLPAPWWLLIYQAMHLTSTMLCWSCFSSLFYLSSPSPQLYSSPSNMPRHPLMFITCFSPCIYYQPPWIAFPFIFISASSQVMSSNSFLSFCSRMFLKPKLQGRSNRQIQLSLQSSHDLLL